MVEYKCFQCGKTITQDQIFRRIRCPYCNYRIIIKVRPRLRKLVKAR